MNAIEAQQLPTFCHPRTWRIVVEQSFVESNAQIHVAEVSDAEPATSNRLSSGSGCFLQPLSERPVIALTQLRPREQDVESSLGLRFFGVVQRAIEYSTLNVCLQGDSKRRSDTAHADERLNLLFGTLPRPRVATIGAPLRLDRNPLAASRLADQIGTCLPWWLQHGLKFLSIDVQMQQPRDG